MCAAGVVPLPWAGGTSPLIVRSGVLSIPVSARPDRQHSLHSMSDRHLQAVHISKGEGREMCVLLHVQGPASTAFGCTISSRRLLLMSHLRDLETRL